MITSRYWGERWIPLSPKTQVRRQWEVIKLEVFTSHGPWIQEPKKKLMLLVMSSAKSPCEVDGGGTRDRFRKAEIRELRRASLAISTWGWALRDWLEVRTSWLLRVSATFWHWTDMRQQGCKLVNSGRAPWYHAFYRAVLAMKASGECPAPILEVFRGEELTAQREPALFISAQVFGNPIWRWDRTDYQT